jgi:hypothetical protein
LADWNAIIGATWAAKLTEVACATPPPIPVTATVYVPGVVVPVAVTVSADVAVPPEVKVTEAGFSPSVTPLGEELDDSATLPENPFRLWRVMVEV